MTGSDCTDSALHIPTTDRRQLAASGAFVEDGAACGAILCPTHDAYRRADDGQTPTIHLETI